MTAGNVKKRLDMILSQRGMKKSLEEKRKYLRQDMTNLHGMCYEDSKVSGGTHSDIASRFDRLQEKISGYDKKILKSMDRLSGLEQKGETLIRKAHPGIWQQVLYDHYINGLSISQIAKKMHYTERRIRQIKSDAIEQISHSK